MQFLFKTNSVWLNSFLMGSDSDVKYDANGKIASVYWLIRHKHDRLNTLIISNMPISKVHLFSSWKNDLNKCRCDNKLRYKNKNRCMICAEHFQNENQKFKRNLNRYIDK